MKFVTYAATPGLERFSERERFRVWYSTHKRLMRTDPEYRRRVRGLNWRTFGTTILFTGLSFALGRFEWPPFEVQLAAYFVLTILYVTCILRTSVGGQLFQNEKVGMALPERVA